jgi:SNF2 family DNA or RNA helicase
MTKLWPHQQDAVDFAADKRGTLLAMEMGTGKTLCALTLLQQWDARRVIILCPKSVMAVWPREFEKHTGNDWHVEMLRDGNVPTRLRRLVRAHGSPYPRVACVLNYDVLPLKQTMKQLKRLKWDVMINDECHRLKSAAGKQSRAASQLADRIPRRLGLTGTPMPHSPLDIYAQMRALDKAVFGTSNGTFKARYAVMGGFQGHQVVGYRDLDDLHRRMYTVTYRCRADEVLDLPDAADSYRTCTLSSDEQRHYNEMEQELITHVGNGVVTAQNALVKLLRLQQITSGYLPVDERVQALGTAKRDLLAEVLEDIAPWEGGEQREPVVVFCRYHHDLDTIAAVCRDQELRCVELSGRCDELAQWQAGDADVVAVQLQAGGLGVDMSRARYCIYYSNSYSLGDYLQTRARVHRPGQTRAVTYIHLLAEGTIDETVLAALTKREDVVRAVVDDMRGKAI